MLKQIKYILTNNVTNVIDSIKKTSFNCDLKTTDDYRNTDCKGKNFFYVMFHLEIRNTLNNSYYKYLINKGLTFFTRIKNFLSKSILLILEQQQ